MWRGAFRFTVRRGGASPPGAVPGTGPGAEVGAGGDADRGPAEMPVAALWARVVLGMVLVAVGALGVWFVFEYVEPWWTRPRMSLKALCVFGPSCVLAFFGVALAWSAWAEAKLYRAARRIRRAGRGP